MHINNGPFQELAIFCITLARAEVHAAYHAAVKADQVWSELLRAQFGKRAGDVRYTPEGKSTPELKAASDAKRAADDKWKRLSDLTKPIWAA